MAINWIRGFRRIGWVATFPIAALIVLFFFEEAKEFSPSDYKVEQTDPRFKSPQIPWNDEKDTPGVVKLEWGDAYFLPEVPQGVVKEILNDFTPKASSLRKVYLDDQGNPMHSHWTFFVHKEVSILKLGGIILGSFACVASLIQGSISIFAWVLRGFKGVQGTSHIGVS
jgi:hypothetical protein